MENKPIKIEKQDKKTCKVTYIDDLGCCFGFLQCKYRIVETVKCEECKENQNFLNLSKIYDYFKQPHQERVVVSKELIDKYGVDLCYLVFKDVYKANLEALTTEIQRAGDVYVFVTTGTLD